eukprot:gene31277-6422_t
MYGRKQSKRKGGIFTSSTESNIPHMQPALARPGHQPPLGRTPAGETHRVATQHVDHPDDLWDQLVVEGIILDMRRLHQSRLPLGEAGKDSRNLTKQRMRAGKCLKSKLEELYIWEGFERDVTIDSLRRTDATIKQWIAGTDPDWVVQDSTLVSAKDLHHGRLWHEVTEDVKRCEEQIGFMNPFLQTTRERCTVSGLARGLPDETTTRALTSCSTVNTRLTAAQEDQ